MPELETDAEGRVQVEVPIADSITTWRVSVLASDQQGNLGSAETGLRVFQEFFVEPDLPRFLTVGDEIAVPVSIFNYLDEAQTIALDVAPGDWFTFTGAAQQTLDVAAAEVTVAYVPIQVTRHGTFEFQVTATGTTRSDAVARAVEVLPDGQQVVTAENGRLQAEQTFVVGVPPSAITDTGRLRVRIYPGITSQVLEGLEGMLHTPYGCFEQTSSITYPNILVLDYLKQSGQANPRIQLQAEQLINLGYQRLLTFEVADQPGGFSLFGEPPAETMLTAYGMMEFGDMADVAYVDPDLLERVFTYLSDQQRFDGAWDPQGMTIESGLEDMNGEVATTAYIVWGLADAGYDQTGAVSSGVAYLLRTLPESPIPVETPDASATTAGQPESPLVEPGQVESPLAVPKPAVAAGYDVYTLALVANALVASDVEATPVLDQLAEQTQATEDTAFWLPGMNTYMGSYGYPATIETTAMVAQAFLRADYRPDLAQGALNFLIENRDPNGSFYTTQATIQALKTLILAAEAEGQGRNATITVTLIDENGETRTETILVDERNRDVVQQVVFEGLTGTANDLRFTVDGDDGLQYQVLTSYYAPWPEQALEPPSDQPMRVSVTYDRTELAVNDTVQAQAEVELLAPGRAGTVVVDLGIPPGFAPVTADLDALVEAGQIERYELTGRQIILYLTDVENGRLYTLPYRLQAKYPIRAQTPASQVYDYYAPDQRATDVPQRIVVTLGTPAN